jgi:hypothetical protein
MKVPVSKTTNYVLRCETVFSGGACMPGRVVVEVHNEVASKGMIVRSRDGPGENRFTRPSELAIIV